MEPFYICVHVFCETSPDALRDVVLEGGVGRLSYAVKISGATYAEAKEILFQNHLKALSQRKFSLPVLNMSPFVEIVKLDWATEYHNSVVSLYTHDAVHKFWSKTVIANALLEYDEWLASSDGALENPLNRECEMLRRCVKQAALLAPAIEEKPKSEPTEHRPQPKKIGNDAYQKEADRLLAFDAVAQKIIDTALANEKIPTIKSICDSLIEQGTWKRSVSTLQNLLTDCPPIQAILLHAKKRPDSFDGKKYVEWREHFSALAKRFQDQLVQQHDAGLTVQDRKHKVKIKNGKSGSGKKKKKRQAKAENRLPS